MYSLISINSISNDNIIFIVSDLDYISVLRLSQCSIDLRDLINEDSIWRIKWNVVVNGDKSPFYISGPSKWLSFRGNCLWIETYESRITRLFDKITVSNPNFPKNGSFDKLDPQLFLCRIDFLFDPEEFWQDIEDDIRNTFQITWS